MSYTAAETGRVQSIKSKFENLNSLESLDISATVPNKYRKPSPKFLFKRSSTSIDLPINRIAVANYNRVNRAQKSPIKLVSSPDIDPESVCLRRHNILDRTASVDTFAVKKRNLIANGEDTLKPLKEIKENVEVRLARHDPVKRSSIKRSPAFRVGDKATNTSSKHLNNAKTNQNDDKINKPNVMKEQTAIITSEFADKFDIFLKRCDIETKQELQEPGLTDTLKALLRLAPLPTGPPPKKPPRTFIDSPKQVQKSDHLQNGGSDDEKSHTTRIHQLHSLVHCAASNGMKQKIDLLENQLVLKTNHKSKATKMATTKEKSPFSSSLLNCIPCSSAAIYDTMIIGHNQFGKVATTSKEPSPEKNPFSKSTAATTATAAVAVATAFSSNRQSASRSHSEPIYMEPFAHLKQKTNIVNGSTSNNHCKHTASSNNFSVSSPTSSHSGGIEPKQLSSSLSNGSFDGPESLGSSLTSCTSCTADDHSITDLHDIHYMVSFVYNSSENAR